MSRILFQNELEEQQHEAAIDRLCDEYPEQSELIRQNYYQNLAPLLSDATIRTYLPIFVSRKVKDTLENIH